MLPTEGHVSVQSVAIAIFGVEGYHLRRVQQTHRDYEGCHQELLPALESVHHGKGRQWRRSLRLRKSMG